MLLKVNASHYELVILQYRVWCFYSICISIYIIYITVLHFDIEVILEVFINYHMRHNKYIRVFYLPYTDDSVHIEQEDQRLEYVMNETGRIWLGTVGKFHVRPWSFAQVSGCRCRQYRDCQECRANR